MKVVRSDNTLPESTFQVVFESGDNPIVSNVDAAVVLPEGYQGSNSSEALARLFSEAILSGKTVEELSSLSVSIQPDYSLSQIKFKSYLQRFGLHTNDYLVTYYSLSPFFDLSNDEIIFAFCELVKELCLSKTKLELGTLMVTINQFHTSGKGEGTGGLPTIDQAKTYFELVNYLRDEGILLTTKDLIVYSTIWTKEETIKVLSSGINYEKLSDLAKMGFTADQVLRSGRGYAQEWIDLILSD